MTDETTNTLAQPGEFDALVKLRPDEPYFPLIGRDREAPRLVEEWADRNRRRALKDYEAGTITRAKLQQELRQSTEAEMIASEMRSYKAGWQADQTSGQARLSYSGNELPEDTARRDRLQSARVRAASGLHNAVAIVTDLILLLEAEHSGDADLEALAVLARDMVHDFKGFADAVTPPRPGMVKVAA